MVEIVVQFCVEKWKTPSMLNPRCRPQHLPARPEDKDVGRGTSHEDGGGLRQGFPRAGGGADADPGEPGEQGEQQEPQRDHARSFGEQGYQEGDGKKVSYPGKDKYVNLSRSRVQILCRFLYKKLDRVLRGFMSLSSLVNRGGGGGITILLT